MTMETRRPNTYGTQQISSKREFYSDTSLPQEIRKISVKELNLKPKTTRKRGTNKTQRL